MKSVEDKYIDVYNSLVNLRNSIMEEAEEEKNTFSHNDVFVAMNILAEFLEMYKKANKLEYITESATDEDENIIVTDPSVWKSVMSKGSIK